MEKNSSRKKKNASSVTWFKLGLLAVLGGAAGSLFTPYPAQLARVLMGTEVAPVPPPAPQPPASPTPEVEAPQPEPEAEPTPPEPVTLAAPEPWSPRSSFAMPNIVLPPFPPALPEHVEPGNYEHINDMGRGVSIRSNVNFATGSTCSQDRGAADAYQLRVSLNLRLPHAAEGDELLHANPQLPNVLPAFTRLMDAARVSPWFHSLYLHKQNRVRKNAATLSQMLDRHNFYDTDTILQIQAPDSGRKVLWIQADMDVVSDGSDGDRLPTMPENIRNSDHYQPTTSYRWRKRTDTPNPLLEGWQERQRRYRREGKRESAEHAGRVIADLERYSFLLAEYDSFIVVPLTVKEGRDATYRPEPGDYAVVVVDNRVFPAIVGDFGPRFKTGEASLRLSKAINPRATVYSRPVSSLGVSYIIFPGSKEPENGPIDYARLNTRCRELLEEIGGIGPEAQFVEMEDLLPQPAPAANN